MHNKEAVSELGSNSRSRRISWWIVSLALLVLTIAVAGLWMYSNADNGPLAGKTVDQWTRALIREGSLVSSQLPFRSHWRPQDSRNWIALEKLGSAAIPVYCRLALIETSPPGWKTFYDQLASRFPVLPRYNPPQNPVPQYAIHKLMERSFIHSADHAEKIALTLSKLLARQSNRQVDYDATTICGRLGELGPAARATLPALTAKLTNDPQPWVRAAALNAIFSISPGTPEAFVALDYGFRDSDELVVMTASKLSVDAGAISPRVQKTLNTGVQSPNFLNADMALNSAIKLVCSTRTNQSILESALKNRNFPIKARAAEFLLTNDARTNLFIATLTELFASSSEEAMWWSVIAAGKVADENREARQLLWSAIDAAPPRIAARAIDALVRLRIRIPGDSSRIQSALEHPWIMVRDAATNGLKALNPHAISKEPTR